MAEGSTIPLTGVYLEQQNMANKAYNDALAEINRKRGELLRLYGYSGTYDDKGNLTKTELSGTNPFGQAQQLNRSEVDDTEAAREAAYGRGLIPTEGLGARTTGDVRQTYDQGRFNLSVGMMEAAHGLSTEQTSAQGALAQAMLQAQMGAIEESKQQRLFTQAEKQFQQQMAQADSQFAQQMAAQNSQFQQQMQQPAFDPYAGMQQEQPPQDPYGGMPTITASEADVMRQYGTMQGHNRPAWVQAIFQAHPGFLSGAQQYIVI